MEVEIKGFFAVPKLAVASLIDASATAKQIGGYLVLARFTDRTGVFSNAGKSAISKYLGISDGAAGEVLNALKRIEISNVNEAGGARLMSKNLILDPKDWPEEDSEKVMWIVNDFNTSHGDRVWLPNGIVDGSRKFTFPLQRLISCRNDAHARALLLLYSEHDEGQVGGVRPFSTSYQSYSTTRKATVGDFSIYEAGAKEDYTFNDSFADKIMGGIPDSRAAQKVLERLESEGFIYRSITVLDGPADSAEAEAIYCLDKKSTCDSTIGASDDTLSSEVNAVATICGCSCSDSSGRFYTRYPVLLPQDYPVHVAAIFRLRFKIRDEYNFIVSKGLDRMTAGQIQAREWIAAAAETAEDERQVKVIGLPEPAALPTGIKQALPKGEDNLSLAAGSSDGLRSMPEQLKKLIVTVGGPLSPYSVNFPVGDWSQSSADNITF